MTLRQQDVVPLGDVATGSLLWRSHGRLHLTVILKTTYALKPGGAMRPVAPAPLNKHEVHYDRRPTRSVKLPSDDVPYLPKTDVLFSGSVFSPAKLPIPFTKVRLAVHGEGSLVDKTLHVHGDRAVGPGGPAPAQPFTELPLVYERALRDPEGADNPVGIDPATAASLPNIEDPDDPQRVAGFGPISKYWRSRRDRISSLSRELLARPVMEVASGFDWSYFQAAPPDQQCRHLVGDEWIVVEGMDPRICAVHCQLPGGTAVASVWPAKPGGTLSLPVQMNADTLFIDGDDRICTVTWRGSFPIAGEEVLDGIVVAAGMHYGATPIDWAAAQAMVARSHPRPGCTAVVKVDEQGMLSLAAPGEIVGPELGDQAVSIVLSSRDLIEIPESLPESAISLDPDLLEEVIESHGAPEPVPPVTADDGDLHKTTVSSIQRAPVEDADDLNKTTVSSIQRAPVVDEEGELGQTTVSSMQRAPVVDEAADLGQTPASEPAPEDPLLQTVAIEPDAAPPVPAASPVPPPAAVAPPLAHPSAPAPPFSHPAAAEPPGGAPVAPPPPAGDADPMLQTLGLSDAPAEAAATPWDRGASPQPAAPPKVTASGSAPAPASPEPTSTAPAGEDGPLGQTLGVEDMPRPPALVGTLDVVGNPPTSLGAPFVVARGTNQPLVLRPADFPGAPWSDEPAAQLVPPSEDPMAETYQLGPEAAAAAKAAAVAASSSSAPPSSVAPASPRSDPTAALRNQLLERLHAGQCVAELDLSAADLSAMDLTGAVLAGAQLPGANLRGACLARADLSGAQLAGADLTGARLDGARIDHANLHGAVLDGASCVAASLVGASFSGASCQQVDFGRSNLRAVQWAGARLGHVSFREARLTRSSLVGVDLSTADLTGAQQED